ncbi:MAG: hypothetical protein N3A54_02035 [Patescibacteria group bacterium]|nr:hypothetical protein [Patescibacteria group bacterium]
MNTDLLKKLCETHAVTGDTEEMITVLEKILKDFGIPLNRNGFGVLLCGNTKNPRFLLSAHCDEVGFQVVSKTERNTFLVRSIGHVSADLLANSIVYVVAGKGRIPGIFYPRKNLGETKVDALTDIELSVLDPSVVDIGDFGSYGRVFFENTDRIFAAGLDNKIGVFLLLEILKEHPELLHDALCAFVTEEETTYDCITGLGYQFNPEYALVFDMMPVHQTSHGKVEKIPCIGEGPGILWSMGKYTIHEDIRSKIETLSEKFTKVFIETDFPPEPQMMQKNGKTKGMNILIPMLGWHNAAYMMVKEDYKKTKSLTTSILNVLK